MTRVLVLSALCVAGCLKPWEPTGPYRCSADDSCPAGLTCDDGLCCQPGGAPACPTLVVDGQCASGRAPQRYFIDVDGDGVGAGAPRLFCSQPRAGGVAPELLDGGRVVLDCDDGPDGGVAINPFAPERCNGLDDNCNGLVDEGLANLRPWFRDVDGDGSGDEREPFAGGACGQPPGYVASAGDCAPLLADVFPGAPERCNNRDDNCNGQPDDAPFIDAESPGGPTVSCTQNLGECSEGGVQCRYDAGARANELACVPRTSPRAERCNGRDDDCNMLVDDAPGCGGPPSLSAVARGLIGAVRVAVSSAPTPSKLPAGCMKNRAGADAQSWFSPSWLGSKGIEGTVGVRHTWFVEAESGTTWDLSQRTQLSVALDDRTQLVSTGFPIFTTAYFPGPVVTLCSSDDEYLRLSPTMNQLPERGSFRGTLSLAGANAGWAREQSPGFSLSSVKRIELTVSPNPIPDGGVFEVRTFIVTVLPDAGFGP